MVQHKIPPKISFCFPCVGEIGEQYITINCCACVYIRQLGKRNKNEENTNELVAEKLRMRYATDQKSHVQNSTQ